MTQIRKIKDEHLKEAEDLAEERVIKPYTFAKQAVDVSMAVSTVGLEKYRHVLKEEIKSALAIQIGLEEADKKVIEDEEEPEDFAERLKRYEKLLKEEPKEEKVDKTLIKFSLLVGYGVSYMLLSKEMDDIDKKTIDKFDEKLGKLKMTLPNSVAEALEKERQYISKIIKFLKEQKLINTEEERDAALLFAKYKISKQRYEMQREKESELKEYKKLSLQINSFNVNQLEVEDSKTGTKVGEKAVSPELGVEEVLWEDVVGQEEAKKMLRDTVVRFLATYDHSTKKSVFEEVLGTKAPKAILLFGPPGSGKTYTAKAAVTEAERLRKKLIEQGKINPDLKSKNQRIHFNIVSSADIKNKYVGESGKSIKKVFETAKKEAPSLLIIDEIDALFSKRRDNGFNEGEREICSIMMQELDGVMKSEGYVVLGITNMPKSLDRAITSRFASRIEYKHPKDEKEVIGLFKVHFKNLFRIKALPKFTEKDWKKVGETGFKHRFTGRLVKQFSEQIERERNDLLTEVYKNNEEIIKTYYNKPAAMKKEIEKHGKKLTCDKMCQKMIDFSQAMYMSEEYSGV